MKQKEFKCLLKNRGQCMYVCVCARALACVCNAYNVLDHTRWKCH
jgi:hypothetical protein